MPSQSEVAPENDISPRFNAAKDEEIPEETPVETSTEKRTGKRRGIWRKIRVRPADAFEGAESQHFSQPAYNVLLDEYQNKYDAKGAYNSFTKGYFGQQEREIETASALTMEKEPEPVTEEVAIREEEVITSVPEAKIDATEDVEKDMEATTILPEAEQTPVEEEEPKQSQFSSTSDSILDEIAASTTESIYDEVRKSLSELFSRTPEGEEVPTDATPVTEEALRDTTTATPSTTSEEPAVTEERKQDEAQEIARVIELSTEPEIKANVTEINRSYVIATSTSQQVTHETEICYRGRCIKSIEGKKKN